MTRRLVGVVALLACSTAAAEEIATTSERPRSSIEAGVFGGGFISNYFHQFYDIAIPDRQELERVNPMLGMRFAYFPLTWLGGELEGAWTMATTKLTQDAASIYGLRAQAVFQYPTLSRRVLPFATLGLGVAHVSSDRTVLGTDTDMLLHVGAGVRVFVTDSIAIRAEGRFLRGPSQQAPYHLNASYGELMFGVSFAPDVGPPAPTTTRVEVVAQPVDTDGDGLMDDEDRCPTEPEDKDLFDDSDGCPDPDNDGDLLADTEDRCPLDAEDKDGFEDADGCPDKDNDNDGIADAQDGCPNEPEDRDEFRDTDGCPEPDNDLDGIADAMDRCPIEPETINGVEDNDGCPDVGDAAVVLSPDRLELFAPIAFQGTRIAKASLNVLGQVGAMLRRHTQILRLRITVHVQPTNDPDKDQALSEKRGEVVRDWLVEWGIDRKRLEVRGFGSTKPLVPARQRNSAQVNNRVELIILERQ